MKLPSMMNSLTAIAIIVGIVLLLISFVQINGKFMYATNEQDPNSDFSKLTSDGQIMVIIGSVLLALGSVSLAKMAYDARKK